MNNHHQNSSDETQRSDIWAVDLEGADPNSLQSYDYDLAPSKIAADPADRRDHSRLLVAPADTTQLHHDRFENLGDHLNDRDLLVFNSTRVIPARLRVHKQTGGKVELFVLSTARGSAPQDWQEESGPTLTLRCMTRSSKPLRTGMILSDEATPSLPAIEVESVESGRATVTLPWQGSALAFLKAFGEVPLPPYIVRRRKDQGRHAVCDDDLSRYQTVYADAPGAVAAPTAGLHFTDPLLDALDAQGVQRATLTLTVGPGTFAPIRDDDLSDHDMHGEDYFIPETLHDRIRECQRRGGRIIAVGTTSTRALEAEARRDTPFQPGWRRTHLFLRPGQPFEIVDGLITNFHLPRSTLLALVAGFASPARMREIYEAAVARGYRFYSYGDASLIFGADHRRRQLGEECP